MDLVCRGCERPYHPDNPPHIPRNLSCGHTFCSQCIGRYVTPHPTPHVTCPHHCSPTTPLPPHLGVDGLPLCHTIIDSLRGGGGGVWSDGGKYRADLGMSMLSSDRYLSSTTKGANSVGSGGSRSGGGGMMLSGASDMSGVVGGGGSYVQQRPPAFNPAAAGGNPSDSMYTSNPPYPILPYPLHSNPSGGGAGGLYPPPPPHLAHLGPASVHGNVDSPVLTPKTPNFPSFPSFPSLMTTSTQPPPLPPSANFKVIHDNFRTLEEVQAGLRRAGLEASNLVIAIDYTKSNTWTGEKTFGGRCLHWTDPSGLTANPYQSVVSVIGRTLQSFDDDNLIPAFGFGDRTTCDKSCFPFYPDGAMCEGVEGVLRRYNEITPHVVLAGPTNFAPVIREAIRIVAEARSYHILLIIADGQVTSKRDTETAIVEASYHPLSIIVVGVGDGPWEVMEEFDDGLPARQFDNFQFVRYDSIMKEHPGQSFDAAFATAALMEIPEQFQAIRELNML